MNKSEQEIIEGIRKIRLGKRIQLISFLAIFPVGIIAALIEEMYGISFLYILAPYAFIALSSLSQPSFEFAFEFALHDCFSSSGREIFKNFEIAEACSRSTFINALNLAKL